MTVIDVDFAIFGSTPLARLLAGLLASAHGKKVALIGTPASPLRLPRHLDFALSPITRPESWALRTALLPEAIQLVTHIGGRHAVARIDPVFFADGPAATEALGHIRHMAAAFNIACEAVTPDPLDRQRSGVRFLDIASLAPTNLQRWLDQHGVQTLAPSAISIATDGSASLALGTSTLTARQSILADDDAILAHLPQDQWPALLHQTEHASILTTPVGHPLFATTMLHLDSFALLSQHSQGVAAIGAASPDTLAASLPRLLGQTITPQIAGQTRFTGLDTRDGAPAFGRLGGSGPDVIAGLAHSAAFLAPALARWLSGAARPNEAGWFERRLVTRDWQAQTIAEFSPPTTGVLLP